MDDLLTAAQVATMKGVAKPTVHKAIRDGRLKGELVLERVAIRRADAEAWTPSSHGGKRDGAGRGSKDHGTE